MIGIPSDCAKLIFEMVPTKEGVEMSDYKETAKSVDSQKTKDEPSQR